MLENKETMAVSNQLAPICDPKAIAVLIFFRVQQFVVRTIIHGGRFCLANSVKSTFAVHVLNSRIQGCQKIWLYKNNVPIETLRPCLVSCFGCLSKVSQPSTTERVWGNAVAENFSRNCKKGKHAITDALGVFPCLACNQAILGQN